MSGIKLVVFDLDGVLLDARELHFNALNAALAEVDQKFIISREEHLARYDGLPTRVKLDMLQREKGLPASEHERVWKLKQDKTLELLDGFEKSKELDYICSNLRHGKFRRIAVATNSVRKTAKKALSALGIGRWVDLLISNEDVQWPKPNPQMYLKAMAHFGVSPKETIVFEDSHHGRRAALESGAHLCPVKDPCFMTRDLVLTAIDDIERNGKYEVRTPWIDHCMTVLIPMAGAGSRFEKAGYTFPKPLIDVNGEPMIKVVHDNLNIKANFVFIVQKEHFEKYALGHVLPLISPGCKIVQVEGVTEGAACTTMLAREHINNDDPLLIANSDQFLEWSSNQALYAFSADGIDAGVVTFRSGHPKWSFLKLDENGFVSQVAEKKPISNIANTGIHYWRRGSDYVRSVEQMIAADDRVNGEFYVAPSLNYLIYEGKKIRIFEIEAEQMHGLGTPEDLQAFLHWSNK